MQALGYMEGWRGTSIPEKRTQKLRTMAKTIARSQMDQYIPDGSTTQLKRVK